ncbi:MAG: hypothetical protein IT290_09700 [Deltaproteobacteria bacterium]|nr:hypothetical protein [Deltaproteobacteria bacterium]
MTLPRILHRTLARLGCAAAGVALFGGALWRAVKNAEFRSTMSERLGGGEWPKFLTTLRDDIPVVWIHAASLGELQGVVPIMRSLSARYPNARFLLTTTSFAGRAAARSMFPTVTCLFLPLDVPFVASRIARAVNPAVFLNFETEMWPNLLFALQSLRTKVFFVNGRISDFSFQQYKTFRALFGEALRGVQTFFVQTDLDRERFVALNVQRGRIQVCGSTKYDQGEDVVAAEDRVVSRREFRVPPGSVCLVAGSVRPGEDALVIAAFIEARRKVANLSLIIAPRHADRFSAVGGLLHDNGLEYLQRSSIGHGDDLPVLLLDTLGELKRAYGAGDLAFVGGTLVDIGGHNPFEPAMFGIPVIVGPSVKNVRDAVSELKRSGGLFQVEDGLQLAAVIERLARDESLRRASGESARRTWVKNLGATRHVISEIDDVLVARIAHDQPQSPRAVGER